MVSANALAPVAITTRSDFAVALKIADGGDRARPPVMVAALGALGVDVATVEPLVEERIMGHGRQVGTVRAVA